MKPLFFIILCVNIVFFFWEMRSGALDSGKPKRQEAVQYEKQIFLPIELKLKKRVGVNLIKDNAFTNNKLTSNIERACFEIGPFKDQDSARDWLNSAGANIKLAEIREKTSKYMVYYPAAETFEQSEANVAMLKEQGVQDFWLFRQAELKGIISLGVFLQLDRAEIVQSRLAEKGLNVQIMERNLSEQLFFITAPQKNSNKSLIDQLTADSDVKVSTSKCN